MYSVRIIQATGNRTFEQNFMCEHYKRELINESKEDFQHYLTLYGVDGMTENDSMSIDLHNLPEDKYGKYDQTVFVMNDKGKTIDRF